MSDNVNKPNHYTKHPSGVECIDIAKHFNFNLGNVIKYVWRADSKGNALEDLRKARKYIDFEIEQRERAQIEESVPPFSFDKTPDQIS